MKNLLSLIALTMLLITGIHGQQLAFANHTVNHEMTSYSVLDFTTHKEPKTYLIALFGGTAATIGCISLLVGAIDLQKAYPYGQPRNESEVNAGTSFLVAGYVLFIAGSVTAIGGTIYAVVRHHRYAKFSMIFPRANAVGLAYNL